MEHREAAEHTAVPQENTHKVFLVEGSIMLRNLPYRKAARNKYTMLPTR